MMLGYLKQTALYQSVLRPVVWFPIKAQRRFIRQIRDHKRDSYFARVAEVEREMLARARADYEESYRNEKEPLVTITIATYNRGRLLVEQTLPSALQQTYERIEVVVVGDCCADDTAELIGKLGDPRVRFLNLPIRPVYPRNRKRRRMVAGTPPANLAMDMAQGSWIARLDDDDLFTPDHIEVMLRAARADDLELVFGRRRQERLPGEWVERGGPRFPSGDPPYDMRDSWVAHSSVVFRTYLRLFRYDMEAWRQDIGADGHRWIRMARAGVRAKFVDHLSVLQPLRPGEMARSTIHYRNQRPDAW